MKFITFNFSWKVLGFFIGAFFLPMEVTHVASVSWVVLPPGSARLQILPGVHLFYLPEATVESDRDIQNNSGIGTSQ